MANRRRASRPLLAPVCDKRLLRHWHGMLFAGCAVHTFCIYERFIMFKDRTLIWFLEYVLGGMLAVVPLTSRILRPPAWTEAHLWATQLFVVSLGVILISCASSMRQRLLLARRIDGLARQMAEGCGSPSRVSP